MASSKLLWLGGLWLGEAPKAESLLADEDVVVTARIWVDPLEAEEVVVLGNVFGLTAVVVVGGEVLGIADGSELLLTHDGAEFVADGFDAFVE